jgi:hypothetical protein
MRVGILAILLGPKEELLLRSVAVGGYITIPYQTYTGARFRWLNLVRRYLQITKIHYFNVRLSRVARMIPIHIQSALIY